MLSVLKKYLYTQHSWREYEHKKPPGKSSLGLTLGSKIVGWLTAVRQAAEGTNQGNVLTC